MLVLSREIGEKICIDSRIIVTVLDIRGDNVLIGIDAPKDVHIVRSELIERPRPAETTGEVLE